MIACTRDDDGFAVLRLTCPLCRTGWTVVCDPDLYKTHLCPGCMSLILFDPHKEEPAPNP